MNRNNAVSVKSTGLAAMMFCVALAGCNGPSVATDPAVLSVSKQHLAGEYNKGTDDGPGYHGEGGPSDGAGVYGMGGGDGPGVVGRGAGFDGSGVVGQGNGYGSGGIFAGGANGPGVYAYAGTPSTATERRAALVANGGHMEFHNYVSPSSNVAMHNVVTPTNVAKAWVVLSTNGFGEYETSILDGANIAHAGVFADSIEITLSAPVVGQCAALVTGVDSVLMCRASCAGDQVVIRCASIMSNGLVTNYNFGGEPPTTLSVVVFGRQ